MRRRSDQGKRYIEENEEKSESESKSASDSSSEEPPTINRRQPWGQNLYQRRSVADNYTDPEFLSALRVNPNLRIWNVSETALKSSRVAMQICASVLFVIVYHHMSHDMLVPRTVLLMALLSSILGYFLYKILPNWPVQGGVFSIIRNFPREHLRVTVVYLIFSYQLAPVLRTLTATISTDTIHATSIFMILVHLLTCDYGMSGFLVSTTISVNAAVIGSICLASRMSSDYHSLALLTFAVEAFILFPMFCTVIWESSLSLVLLIVIVSFACFTVSSFTFIVFLIVIFFVVAVVPVLFVLSVQFKNNIYGPWDEAVLNLDAPPNETSHTST